MVEYTGSVPRSCYRIAVQNALTGEHVCVFLNAPGEVDAQAAALSATFHALGWRVSRASRALPADIQVGTAAHVGDLPAVRLGYDPVETVTVFLGEREAA
jgi:hypothetical protein